MKRFCWILLLLGSVGFSYAKSSIRFNGSQENEFTFHHAKDYGNWEKNKYGTLHWGLDSLTNLRLRADVGEYLSFDLAVNINLLAGISTDVYKLLYLQKVYSDAVSDVANPRLGFLSIPFYYKSTYIGGFELERASFKVGNDFFDYEMGLMRLARGFGYAFSPNDLFNPKNSYNQNARLEGRLAAQLTFYPKDMWKVQLFGVAPDNPLETQGWGIKTGISSQFSISKFNFAFMYVLALPEIEYGADPTKYRLLKTVSSDFEQIVGFSMKCDVELGLFIDAVYRFDHRFFKNKRFYDRSFRGYDGLEAAIGVDYTFAAGKVYWVLEYMFYGPAALDYGEPISNLYRNTGWETKTLTSRVFHEDKKPGNFLRHDYLFSMVRGKANDYLFVGGSVMIGLDDGSWILTPFVEIEPFQAFTVSLQLLSFFDLHRFHKELPMGEFGPVNTGTFHAVKICAKFKF